MFGLIEGLRDAFAIRCLAWVPFYLHPKLELISVLGEQPFVALKYLMLDRKLVNLRICQLYDPVRDLWIALPVFPSKIRHLLHLGAVSTARKLFVIGGGSDAVDPLIGDQDGCFATNEVWSYGPVVRQWALCAAMLVPGSMFACCVLNGKIVVTGGFTSCRKSISQSEMYDPQKDVCIPVPDLHPTHNSACSGVVTGGKAHGCTRICQQYKF